MDEVGEKETVGVDVGDLMILGDGVAVIEGLVESVGDSDGIGVADAKDEGTPPAVLVTNGLTPGAPVVVNGDGIGVADVKDEGTPPAVLVTSGLTPGAPVVVNGETETSGIVSTTIAAVIDTRGVLLLDGSGLDLGMKV